MTTGRLRPAGALLLAVLCAAVLGLTSALSSALAYSVDQLAIRLRLLADTGWIMSGTGVPDPSVGPYLGQILAGYLQPTSPLFTGQPTFPGYNFQGLATPEQFCPFVCIPGQPALNFGQSLNTGVGLLNQSILPQLLAGDNVTVFGYSQSAAIATIEMQNLIANAGTAGYPTLDQLGNMHVVLIGDPNNPIGGILDRFQFPDDQHLPFVNIPLSLTPPRPSTLRRTSTPASTTAGPTSRRTRPTSWPSSTPSSASSPCTRTTRTTPQSSWPVPSTSARSATRTST